MWKRRQPKHTHVPQTPQERNTRRVYQGIGSSRDSIGLVKDFCTADDQTKHRIRWDAVRSLLFQNSEEDWLTMMKIAPSGSGLIWNRSVRILFALIRGNIISTLVLMLIWLKRQEVQNPNQLIQGTVLTLSIIWASHAQKKPLKGLQGLVVSLSLEYIKMLKEAHTHTHLNTGGFNSCAPQLWIYPSLFTLYSIFPLKGITFASWKVVCKQFSCSSAQRRELNVNVNAVKIHACLPASFKMKHGDGVSWDPACCRRLHQAGGSIRSIINCVWTHSNSRGFRPFWFMHKS